MTLHHHHHEPHGYRETIGLEPSELEVARDEKHTPDQPDSKLPSDSPISYLYLTPSSDLPLPPTPREVGLSEDTQLPLCPNLKPYVSPFTWSTTRKNVCLALSCAATFLTAYSASTYSPPSRLMAKDLHTSHTGVLFGITTFCAGFAVAPMALAPISEIWGRYPVFAVAGLIFVVFQAACSVMPDLAGMLICRFLVGCGGSVFSSVVGGVIADVWPKEERNTPMALFSGCVLLGTGGGPLVAAAFIQDLSDGTQAWKWSFWHQVILDGLLVVALVVLFRESRASVLLSKKARVLNKWYEELEASGAYGVWVGDQELEAEPNSDSSATTLQPGAIEVKGVEFENQRPRRRLCRIRWVVKEDEERASLVVMMSTSIQRPFYLLFTEPVVFFFSMWAAFSWGILYLSFAVVPYLYPDDFEMSSRIYIAICASAVAATVTGIWQEKLIKSSRWQSKAPEGVERSNKGFWAFVRRKFPAESPEARLYFACLSTALLPLGLYGAFLSPASQSGHAQAIGLGFANWGIYSVYLATFNYLADTYHIYASSALAAQGFCRNVLGGAFPVITSTMFNNLGLKGAGGLLAGIATVMTLTPWVLVFFGERIRARSSFAISLQ